MNILIICRCLSIGGAERVATCWSNGLNKLGHKIFILTDTTIPQTYFLEPEIKIISLPYGFYKSKGLIKNLLNRVYHIKQLKGIIDNNSIDAVIKIMHPFSIELLIAANLSIKKPSLIMTDHNAYERPMSIPMSRKLKFQKFWLNRLFDRVTVLTKRDKFITSNHNLHNVEVLYNPLSLKPFYDTEKVRNKTILAVGRMDSWYVKGYDVLIDAWNNICNKYPDWTLRIIGAGKDSSRKFLTSRSINTGQLELLQFTSDILKEYQKSEIFVLSSRYEGWGLVLVEAMSQGCACIACDFIGRQAEIINDNENGLLCAPDDVTSLANKIEILICNKELRNNLRKKAIESVEKFSENLIAKNMENIIKSTLK